jgi:regulatory protein
MVSRRTATDRLVVYVDGVRAFEVAALVAEAERLRAGDRLTAEDVEGLIKKDAPYRAREIALRLLALRDRSRQEIEGRLSKAGFAPEVIGATTKWLQDLGYVDDRRFASRYVAERLRGGWGRQRIVSELIRLGVERQLVRETIDETVSKASDGANDSGGDDAVLELARRRFGREFASDPQKAARRLAGFLARRGFDWDSIGRVTRILQEEAGSNTDDEGR